MELLAGRTDDCPGPRTTNLLCRGDILVCCGDVSDDLATLGEVLGLFKSLFAHVFFVPGNHELWVRQRDRAAGTHDSVTKLRHVLELCARLGVLTAPDCLGGRLWIVPLYAWHHQSWDKEPDIDGIPPATALTVSDYAATRWPAWVPGAGSPGSMLTADWFDSLNDSPAWEDALASRQDADVISFSHFLPHQELLPEKRL